MRNYKTQSHRNDEIFLGGKTMLTMFAIAMLGYPSDAVTFAITGALVVALVVMGIRSMKEAWNEASH